MINIKKIIIIITSIIILITILIYLKLNNPSLDKLITKAKNTTSYQLIGDMEILQNDELKSYEVKVDYLKKAKNNYYKVELYDKSLNQAQIIIKNKKAVYVLTPTINQTFKFQSNWPDNGPKPYIYHYLINLLDNNKVKKIDKGYQIKAKVKYPNDNRIKMQEVIFDKQLKPLIVLCLDKDDREIITLQVKEFKHKKYQTKHFNHKKVNTTNKVSTKLDILYPITLLGSSLDSETVSTISNNKNHILRFTGNKNYTLIESKQDTIDTTNLEVIDLIDNFAFYTPGKLSINYYGTRCDLYSKDLTKEEMIQIVSSMQTSSLK